MHSLLTHPRLIDCRCVYLRDYTLSMRIGAYDFEKKRAQRVLLSVELYVPLAVSTPKNDQLREVLNTDFIRDGIASRVAQGHIQLQETLCDDVLRLMLAHPHVRAARVSSEKPDAYPDSAAVGVEVFGFREGQ